MERRRFTREFKLEAVRSSKQPAPKPRCPPGKSVSLIYREAVEQPHAASALKPVLATAARRV